MSTECSASLRYKTFWGSLPIEDIRGLLAAEIVHFPFLKFRFLFEVDCCELRAYHLCCLVSNCWFNWLLLNISSVQVQQVTSSEFSAARYLTFRQPIEFPFNWRTFVFSIFDSDICSQSSISKTSTRFMVALLWGGRPVGRDRAFELEERRWNLGRLSPLFNHRKERNLVSFNFYSSFFR